MSESHEHLRATKSQLKGALFYLEQRLYELDVLERRGQVENSPEAKILGELFVDLVLGALDEVRFTTDNELFDLEGEPNEVGAHESDSTTESEDGIYEPEEKKPKVGEVAFAYKKMVTELARAHPGWNLSTLQKKGCAKLQSMKQLAIWVEEVRRGGTLREKCKFIDKWVYDRYREARDSHHQVVTTRTLQEWGLAAATECEHIDFKASKRWAAKFKKRHRISQRKTTRRTTVHDTATLEELMAAVANFRRQVRLLAPNFEKNLIINTDQTGCQYQTVIDRTLDDIGKKEILVAVQNMNKVTHSYTAQYSLVMAGALLPFVFVCLQEPKGQFGPLVQEQIRDFSVKYPNVVIRCSASGKLSTKLYEEYLEVLKVHVGKRPFLLLVDSWSGQTNPLSYERFEDENGAPTCTLKVIPPKSTSMAQPCDVYFYRQVKILLKRLQHASHLLLHQRELTSREDSIKLHAIIHHQLSSPIFQPMLTYAWFAAGLSDERTCFLNVNQVCFDLNLIRRRCNCGQSGFIACARCRNTLCFPCFYDKYHTGTCN